MSAADLARARKLATAAADDVETRPDAAMARAAAAEALIALDLAEKNAAFHALIDGQETAPPPAPQITAEWLAANPWLLADPERLATREQLASAPAGTVVETESGYRFRQAAEEGWTTGVGSVFDGAVTVGDLLEAGARIVEKPLPHTVDAPAWPPLAGATREIRTARYALREVVRIVRDAEGELDRPAYGSALSWVRYGQSQLDRAEAALMGQSAPAASASASADGPRREQPANQHETYRALFEAVLRAATEAHSTRSEAQFATYAAACEDVDTAARAHVTALDGPATGGYEPANLAAGSFLLAADGRHVFLRTAGVDSMYPWRVFPGLDETREIRVRTDKVPLNGVLIFDGATLGGSR